MLSPGDHCLRPVRSLLFLFGLKPPTPVASHPPLSCALNKDTGNPSTLRHQPHEPTSRQQAQANGPALAGVSPQPPASDVEPPSPLSSDCHSPIPPHHLPEDVASGDANFSPKPTTVGWNGQSCPLTPQHTEECHLTHQSCQTGDNERLPHSAAPYLNGSITSQLTINCPAQSASQHVLVGPSRLGDYPTSEHSQNEQVPQLDHRPQYSSANHGLSLLQFGTMGAFYQAHNFVIKDSVFIDNGTDNFMSLLLKSTIIGAEFDSSDPNMPLRCHPGTRLKIIKRCQDFILDREGRPKLRWVVGAAGVGKSAVMQSVAREGYKMLSTTIVGATIFFSINGRQNGTKALTTIAYQLAVKLHSYRLFIQREVTNDPSLLRKSLSTQFEKFIIEPFIYRPIPDCPSSLLIIVDGLDECDEPFTQLELLSLISKFCITYTDSPIVWMIASRPEPHILSFFSQPEIVSTHEMEQILVDSDEAREDVKLYLLDKFREIQIASLTLRRVPRWPSEGDFSKVAKASGGLFAYASTVVRYIGNPICGNPVGQLNEVLEVIDTGASTSLTGEDHPMARLDALYAHIMSKIPAKIKADTRKLLILSASRVKHSFEPFYHNCNFLGVTESTAYAATHHIRAVADVPGPEEAIGKSLTFFHKSYRDYLQDFSRSGFSPNIESEARQLLYQCGLRIIEEAPDGFNMDGAEESDLWLFAGILKNGPGTGDNISVSWPAAEEADNRKLRLHMYRDAVGQIMDGVGAKNDACQSLLCLRVLATCFDRPPDSFLIYAFPHALFGESRRRELLDHGILKQVPLGSLGDGGSYDHVFKVLRFRSPTPSDPWDASCEHGRQGKWEGPNQDWEVHAIPAYFYSSPPCPYCMQRFERHLKMQSPDHPVTVCEFSPTNSMIELRFVDPGDGVSEWTYYFTTCRDTAGSGSDSKEGEEVEKEKLTEACVS